MQRRAVLGGIVGLVATGQCALAEKPKLPDSDPQSWRQRLVATARGQIGKTLLYDPAYTAIAYPGGDVPLERGTCTDVLIRAYRKAFDVDLQKNVHEDMLQHFALYPKLWGLTKTDRNIDHRRVRNLEVFFARKGQALMQALKPEDFRIGDIVAQLLPGNLPHIGIVSGTRTNQGRPNVIHNSGRGTQEEDILAEFPITGRYAFDAWGRA